MERSGVVGEKEVAMRMRCSAPCVLVFVVDNNDTLFMCKFINFNILVIMVKVNFYF